MCLIQDRAASQGLKRNQHLSCGQVGPPAGRVRQNIYPPSQLLTRIWRAVLISTPVYPLLYMIPVKELKSWLVCGLSCDHRDQPLVPFAKQPSTKVDFCSTCANKISYNSVFIVIFLRCHLNAFVICDLDHNLLDPFMVFLSFEHDTMPGSMVFSGAMCKRNK